MIAQAGCGHPGGSLSIVEILTFLYFNEMKHDPKTPSWPKRDRLILSKGHAAPILYAILSKQGYISTEDLNHLRKKGSVCQGHPDRRFLPHVEVSSGSLGMGLGVASGLALSLKLDKLESFVYVILGDGEIQEGMVWEAAMTAAKYKLGNIIAFLDKNNLQIDGPVEEVMPLEPVYSKWQAFNWHVEEIDGHNFQEIKDAIKKAKKVKDKPSLIVANTVKGKGVSCMENVVEFHGKAPNEDETRIALEELDEQ